MNNSNWLRQLLTPEPFTPQALVVSHSVIPTLGRPQGLRRMMCLTHTYILLRCCLLPIAYCLVLYRLPPIVYCLVIYRLLPMLAR